MGAQLKNKKIKGKFPSLEELKSSGETIHAIIYCRVSSDRQANEGNGLDSQEQRCIDFAQRNGYVVSKEAIFKESASGEGPYTSRKKQVELVNYIDSNAHKNFVLIVDETSRLARDAQGHFGFRVLLKQKGVDVASPNFNFEDSPEGELVEGMMAMVNQYHRKGNKRQVVQKMKARLESGYWSFGGKKGYEMIKELGRGKIAVPHPVEGKLLAKALEGFADGTFVRKIDACKYLVDNGFWKRAAPEKYINKFDEFLRDPFYCGDIEYKKWDVERRKGRHQAIISVETYEKNQKRLSSNQVRPRRDIREDFPMRGLIVCADCGGHLTASTTTAKGHSYGYYFCQNFECASYRVSLSRADVELRFVKVLETSPVNTGLKQLTKNLFEEVWQEEMNSLKGEESLNEKAKAALQGKITTLTEMAMTAKSPTVRSMYEEQIEMAAKELDERGGQLLSESDLKIPYRNALDKALTLLENPSKIWAEVGVMEKHRLFFFLFETKIPYSLKDGYRNDNISYAVRLFAAFAGANTMDVEMGVSKPRVIVVNK